MKSARLILDNKEFEFPVVIGSENEVGIDFNKLRDTTGAISLDPSYGNTGSCRSAITYIDGDKGILRYRGYPIEQLAEFSSFEETAYLTIYGELPTKEQLDHFKYDLGHHSLIHENFKHFLDGYPTTGHPMAIFASLLISMSAYYPGSAKLDDFDLQATRLLSKSKTYAAFAYKKSIGHPYIYPRNDQDFAEAFLYMMFAVPAEDYKVPDVYKRALNLLLILHADHEQNCSTSTVRMVGSSGADMFSAIGAGVCALSGPLHGGANQEVIQMLEMIQADGGNYKKYINMAKDKESNFRLMGFGHRVYKNFDPRATILKQAADEVLASLGRRDPLLEIAQHLEEVALKDSYFVERKLYPNVDFYSGIIYRAMGIPTNMFTVMFALGRMPGWIAHWREMRQDPDTRISRPRQVYTGATVRNYVPVAKR